MIYDRVIELNKAGTYFPIWGICLGFQHLAEYMAVYNPIKPFDLTETNMPITFSIPDIRASRFFANIEDYYFNKKDFEISSVFFHQHNYGVPVLAFETDVNLKAMVKVIATDVDATG
jgi:gamma-glutamyl hydrolase